MFKNLIKEENGQSLVLVAVSIIALIGFAGLAIDGGRLYLAKSQLQKAVDAGALAGADVLLKKLVEGPVSQTEYDLAKDEAGKIAGNNYTSNVPYTPKAYRDGPDYVEVYGEEDIQLFLMPVLNLTNSKVSAFAKVKIGNVNKFGKSNVIPIGVHLNEELEFGDPWKLLYGPGDGKKGNYGFLDFSKLENPPQNKSGAKDVAEYFTKGSPIDMEINKTTIQTVTGSFVSSNHIQNAIENIINSGGIVYVPIVTQFGVQDEFDDSNGQDKVMVIGFAAFKVTGYNKDTHQIDAEFQRMILPGEIGDETSEYGTFISKLVM
ncbi:hypothetical protein FAY30_20145 [Bacillus sp. S3]|uniref:Tad domain-containing protein n=1 Tax=Bacillus sp. S3 TaxID=486398 RepID=UPI0011898085|nr:Tad domain-containing protein [Bacillus sp. S3]QCJ44030.1 hypothetical protein FAY30_20145 [Bacillus sp. S3]